MTARQRVACAALAQPGIRLVLRPDGFRPGWCLENARGVQTRPLHAATVAALRAHGWVDADGVLTGAGRAAWAASEAARCG